MFTSLRRLSAVIGTVMVLAASTAVQALPLNGSLPLNGFSTTQNGANLALSTLITSGDTVVTGAGLVDFAPVPLFASFGPHTLDLSNLVASFGLTNAGIGTFTPTSASILTQSANFLDILFLGTFTPAVPGLLDTFDASPTTMRISINQSGESLSEAITLNSVIPERVPEPASMLLLLASVAGMAAVRRRARLA